MVTRMEQLVIFDGGVHAVIEERPRALVAAAAAMGMMPLCLYGCVFMACASLDWALAMFAAAAGMALLAFAALVKERRVLSIGSEGMAALAAKYGISWRAARRLALRQARATGCRVEAVVETSAGSSLGEALLGVHWFPGD